MDENTDVLIDISQLRIGMYIQLDLNWMSHPFPVSSFRIASESQIEILRELGLTQIRYHPSNSDLPPPDSQLDPAASDESAEDAALAQAATHGASEPSVAPESDSRRAAQQRLVEGRADQRIAKPRADDPLHAGDRVACGIPAAGQFSTTAADVSALAQGSVSLQASICKYFASEMCGRVADRAVQIFGGAGYMADYGIERFYRDVRLFRLYEGTTQIQQIIIARNMVREATR